MGFVSYGMDYFDASNMLSVYKGGGRHDWDNAAYDNLLAQGAAAFDKSQAPGDLHSGADPFDLAGPRSVRIPRAGRLLDVALPQGGGAGKNDLGYTGLQWPGSPPIPPTCKGCTSPTT